MAVITPQTNIRIIKLPLELDNKNQLTFSTKANQESYFLGLDHLELTNATYMRADDTLRFNTDYDTAIQYNYVMYKNSAYSDKWFYAFITNVEWLSNNSVAIKIKNDVFQTWQFDIEYKQSFIEREHVNDDTIGKHTVPENLETGEYILTKTPIKLNNFDNGAAICVAVSDFPTSITPPSTPLSINNIYAGLHYCIFSHSDWNTACSWVDEFISLYDSNAKANAIVSIFLVPKAFAITDHASVVTIGTQGHFFYWPNESTSPNILVESVNVTRNTKQGENYNVVNNKLFTYPYNYFVVSNNAGTDVVFNYEDFINNNPSFKIIGAITPGCSIKCVPLNYKKIADSNGSMNSFNYGVAGAKLPVCAWNSDTYTNWLTENGVSMAWGTVGSVAAMIAGGVMIASGIGAAAGVTTIAAGAGMAASGVGNIANTLITNQQHSLAADQAQGNSSVGDVIYASGNSVFTAYQMGLRKENSQIIDKFFSMYGYKVNITKTPNITGRRNWNFIKTIGCNIHLYAPQSDVDELKNMFDNGLTLWHNTSTYLDYSQNNDII